MEDERHIPIEEMEVFQRFVELADWAWSVVSQWSPLAMDTVGKQLVKALDRVGATLVEGDGRYGDADAIHFFIMARASAREARYWIQRAAVRNLIPASVGDEKVAALIEATRMLNGLIRYRRTRIQPSVVREPQTSYLPDEGDPFTTDSDCLTPNT